MKTLLTLATFTTILATQLPDANAVRDRLDKYLIEYEPQLSSLVADERMTQRDGASRNAKSEPTKDREIRSEVAFISLPGDAGWLGFRRVMAVNGKKLPDPGPGLAQLLTDGAKDDFDQARLLLVAALAAAQPAPLLDAVLAKMDVYLAAYEPRLSELIADESMLQEVRGSRGLRLERRLDSEVAFIALPLNIGWLGFRHVKTVDTRPVELADASLTVALGTPGLERARTLLRDSAKHNLGLPRTSNLPNLPLEFLHRRNRQRFVVRADGEETVRGNRTLRVVFVERMTPTVIQNRDTGGDLPSVVRAWIDSRDGRLMRAEVETFASASAKQSESSLRVEFAENKTLGLFVPIEMRETFPAGKPLRGRSVASYTNFRRFQTSARIVPPPQ